MRNAELPGVNGFRMKILRIDTAVSMAPLAIMLFYLHMLMSVSSEEWVSIGWSALVYGTLCFGIGEPIRARMQSGVRRYLAEQGEGTLSSDAIREAFRCVMLLPRRMMRLSFGMWVSAGFALPGLMVAFGHPAWGPSGRMSGVFVAAVTGGLISGGFIYFASKRMLASERAAIAADIPDPEERRALITPVTLSRKLQYVVAGSGAASLVFVMGLAEDQASKTYDELAAAWQERVLEQLAPRLEREVLDDAIATILPDASLYPYAVEFAIVGDASSDDDALTHRRLLARVAAGEQDGSSAGLDSATVLTWRVLRDGRILVATTPLDSLHAPLDSMRWMLIGVLVIALGLSISIALLLAHDVEGTVGRLRSEADRMACGDLRPRPLPESDDELGDLARAFERMAGALRATVGRVAEAADRVDGAAGSISDVSQQVATSSEEQLGNIQQATQLMDRIREQVGGVAGSAQALGESVEESSSSILELGAAGDELNETASVLSDRVDDVSTSIEEMVRSVKQVASSSEGLADAASDTSASMEEMASAMRAVDTTAEKTGDLSLDVIASAESGQEKVRQTIEGMQAIRDATDAAERVIRGLGDRTEEIGAILDVIDDVGDETTLLALNAAIIAAQAGEHGRAFSVVADEIKELADRVLASTKEIGTLIRSVQSEAGNAVGAIEAGSASVAQGVDLSAEAGVSLEQITRSSRESGQHIQQIVGAVREQTRAAVHVSELMERVLGGVSEIRAAGAEQDRGNEVVYRSSVTMREVAQQVRRTTEEQSRGFARIRESVESVRGAVEQINGSLQDQSRACTAVAGFLENLFERSRSNEDSVRGMGDAVSGLKRQAEALREDVAKFQI